MARRGAKVTNINHERREKWLKSNYPAAQLSEDKVS